MLPASFIFGAPPGGKSQRKSPPGAFGKRARAGGEGASGHPGLVHVAYSHSPSVLAAPGASFLEVKYPFHGEPPVGGPRGVIVGRSAGSRRRFLRFMARMRRDSLPVELTLTYPGEFNPDWHAWKEDLRSWGIRLAREWPGLGGVWVLEKQERGAPHFHCLIYGLEKFHLGREGETARPGEVHKRVMGEFRQWASVSWFQTVDSGDVKHLAAGTRVAKVRSRAGVMSYMSGYLSKEGQTWVGEGVGRYWGKFHVEHLPLSEVVDISTMLEPANIDVRTLRKFREAKRREQWRTHRARGSKGKKPGRQRAGTFWVSCDVDAWIARGREQLEGRAWHREQRRNAWEREGWPARLTPTQMRVRQYPRPCGLSTSTHPAAAALERLTANPLLASGSPRVGGVSTCLPGASGGMLWLGGRMTTGVIRQRVGADATSEAWGEWGQIDRTELVERGVAVLAR